MTFEEWDKKCRDWLKTRPICDQCQEPIQEEYGYETEDGLIICKHCAEDYNGDLQEYMLPSLWI